MHLSLPGPDLGHFSTLEVRPSSKPTHITSRTISFPLNHYTSPPNLAGGFKSLHLSSSAPGLRANLIGSDITCASFNIAIETWGKGVLHSASAQWIEHKSGSRECCFGQFDTRDVCSIGGGKLAWKKRVRWPKVFSARGQVPEVVCWLNRLDFESGGKGYRVRAYVDEVTAETAEFHIETWGDCLLNGAAMCWVAFPRGKTCVDSGTFGTADGGANSRRVEFKEDWFKSPPTVLVALNMFDAGGDADLRVRVDAVDVDERGFTWCLDTWDDSTLRSAGASWIALGFD